MRRSSWLLAASVLLATTLSARADCEIFIDPAMCGLSPEVQQLLSQGQAPVFSVAPPTQAHLTTQSTSTARQH